MRDVRQDRSADPPLAITIGMFLYYFYYTNSMKADQTINVRGLLESLYEEAREYDKDPSKREPQPCSKWDAEYVRKLSDAFGIEIKLRPEGSKHWDGVMWEKRHRKDGEKRFSITIYRNKPGVLEHEIAHYIWYGVFKGERVAGRRGNAIEEIRAESTAYVLSMLSGNDSRKQSTVPYIRRYMRYAGAEPEELIPDIESRVAEFLRRGVMPPKYEPIAQKLRFKSGNCVVRGGYGRRRQHLYECEGKEATCIHCGAKVDVSKFRFVKPEPMVA